MRNCQERELDIAEATAAIVLQQEQARKLSEEATYIAFTEGSSRGATAYVSSCYSGKFLVHGLDTFLTLLDTFPCEDEAIAYAEAWVNWVERR